MYIVTGPKLLERLDTKTIAEARIKELSEAHPDQLFLAEPELLDDYWLSAQNGEVIVHNHTKSKHGA